jgi:hypothetical protein
MGLELDRQAHLIGDAQPSLDDRDHVGEPYRHLLPGHDDERSGDPVGEIQRRTQGLDRRRKRGQPAGEPVRTKCGTLASAIVSAPRSIAMPPKPASRTASNLYAADTSGIRSRSIAHSAW